MKSLSKSVVSEYPFIPEAKADVRDVWLHYKDAKRTYTFITSRLVHVDLDSLQEELVPVNCETFESLNQVYSSKLKWTDLNRDALACCTAVTISVRIKGPLLWTYLVGPSGAGKSVICDSLATDKIHTKRVSQFTGLHSGYHTGDPDEDVSLVAKLFDKTLIVPDFTAILGMSASAQEKIYAELRAIYDGAATASYGNNKENTYTNINFSTVAGVTHEIHTIKKSALGERFMKIDLTQASVNDEIVLRAIKNVAAAAEDSLRDPTVFESIEETNPVMREVKAATLGFIQHLYRKIAGGIYLPPQPEAFQIKIAALSQIVAACRANVARESTGDKDLLVRPVLEVGSHVAGQLTKLATALCVVLDRTYDDEILRLVQKVALDTAYGFSRDVIIALALSDSGLTREQVASEARLPPSTTNKVLRDLRELGVVEVKTVGDDANVHYLGTRLQSCWETVYGKRQKKGLSKGS